MLTAPELAGGLAAYSLLLAWPVSANLAAASWARRSPRAALVLWQAICLGAGLSLVGVGVVLAVRPWGASLLPALRVAWRNLLMGNVFAGLNWWRAAAGLAALAIALAMFGVLLRCAALTTRRRKVHRDLVDLLTNVAPTGGGPGTKAALLQGVRILDHSRAVAYTVPGWHSRVVLSAGLVDLLNPSELLAVIDHEQAHVRSRHDLLALPFQAWAVGAGFVPGVRGALAATAELTEMLADDIAVSRSAPRVLACALAKVAFAGSSDTACSPDSVPAEGMIAHRVRRLLDPDPLPRWATAGLYLISAALILGPTASLLIGWR